MKNKHNTHTHNIMKAREYNSPLLLDLLEEVTPLEMEQTNVKMQLAANIEDLIRSKGWSKTRFASELGKSQPEISKWLSGAHNFTIDTLTHISMVLGVDIIALFGKPQTKVVYKMQFVIASNNSLDAPILKTPLNKGSFGDYAHLIGLGTGISTSINSYRHEA
jgi:transcriptional regulator with XRE-family HTH domain